ncbi:MAG: hypothetical protein GY811_13065 [Myxococcales bacterium]|nr:hypothetical protein [Myxococcales bacterium]
MDIRVLRSAGALLVLFATVDLSDTPGVHADGTVPRVGIPAESAPRGGSSTAATDFPFAGAYDLNATLAAKRGDLKAARGHLARCVASQVNEPKRAVSCEDLRRSIDTDSPGPRRQELRRYVRKYIVNLRIPGGSGEGERAKAIRREESRARNSAWST